MTMSRNRIYSSRHQGCRGGPKCRHCTWDTMHVAVDGPHAKYTKGHRGNYNRDIDRAIDDFLATLKLEARRLLRNRCPATVSLDIQLNLGPPRIGLPRAVHRSPRAAR